MKAVMFAISLAHLTSVMTTAQAEPTTFYDVPAVVEDQPSLELRVRDSAGALVVDLVAGDRCARDVEDIVDVISPEAGIRVVTVTIAPSSGIVIDGAIRISHESNVDVVSVPSATGGFAYEIPVPEGDEEATFAYVLEAHVRGQTPTIAVHGYVKIKKLNSGG